MLKEEFGEDTGLRTSYRYNENKQLIMQTAGDDETTYIYDHRGNLTAVSRGKNC